MTALADVKREALKISNMWDISSYCFSAWLQEKLGQISTKRLSYPPTPCFWWHAAQHPNRQHHLCQKRTAWPWEAPVPWNVIEYGWIGRIGEHVRPLRPTSSPSSLLFKVDPHGFPQNASWPNLLWMLLAACSKAWPSPSWSMVHPVHLQRISLACYCSCLHPFSDGNKKHPPKPKRWCPSDS